MCATDLDHDKPPTTKELGRISNEIAYMWKRVGVELGLEGYRLNIIEKDYPKSVDACFHMLQKWTELNRDVSNRVLYQAIEYCKDNKGIVHVVGYKNSLGL